jgi:4-hydroxy-3-polyprenylbenzoate decarboxylase
VIVVDKDVDVTNGNEVFWALATRNHPGRGIVPFENTRVFPLFPFLSAAERQAGRCTTAIFDCTWPADWPKEYVPRRASLASLWPKAVGEKVLRNWTEYGYPAEE